MMFVFGLPDWVILAATACILLYLYASRNRSYWKNQGIVSEPFALIFGPTIQVLLNPLHTVDFARYQKYGRLFGAYEAGKAILFVAEPDLVKQVLVKDFPALRNRRSFTFYEPLVDNMIVFTPIEQWRRLRPSVSPAFSAGKLRKMNILIAECAQVTMEHLRKAASAEEDADVKQLFSNYTLDVIARCAFGTQLDSHSDQSNEFVAKARKIFSGGVTPRLFVTIGFPVIARALKLRAFDPETFQYFRAMFRNIMERRRNEQSRHIDFLQLMIDAIDGKLVDAVESASGRDDRLFNLDSTITPDTSFLSNKGLTEDEALAQCVLFFLAAQDGLSSAIAHSLYLLALHPDKEAKLRNEVDECFATHGDQPSLDAVTKLNYLHCVVSECLRMYPPGTRIDRSPREDYILGNTGVKVRKGDLIAVPIYAMHHDPEYFPDPLTFKPERFDDENVASIQPYTYLPFGAGPRNCIGMRLALQIIKTCLLYTVRNVQLIRTEKTKVPLEFQNGLGALSAKNITLGARKRLQ
ncbi:cytochrome P450 3A24-like isoform X2 [Haemaphysalis longicornis]